MFEYVGSIHMHSIFSDGSGEVPQIAKYANELGLDFIILTDHNTLRALEEGYENWYGNYPEFYIIHSGSYPDIFDHIYKQSWKELRYNVEYSDKQAYDEYCSTYCLIFTHCVSPLNKPCYYLNPFKVYHKCGYNLAM